MVLKTGHHVKMRSYVQQKTSFLEFSFGQRDHGRHPSDTPRALCRLRLNRTGNRLSIFQLSRSLDESGERFWDPRRPSGRRKKIPVRSPQRINRGRRLRAGHCLWRHWLRVRQQCTFLRAGEAPMPIQAHLAARGCSAGYRWSYYRSASCR
jgi:hypothetical protein